MVYWWEQQDLVMHIILMVFAGTAFFQILYYWIVFGRVAFYKNKKKEKPHNLPAVSVIIVAQNDYLYLRKNIISILEQDYPNFEVVIANSSTEETKSLYLLMAMREQYPHLKLVDLPDVRTFSSKKKFLMSVAIKEASYDLFLFTNPDCQPDSKYWIRSVVENMQKGEDIAIGYSGLEIKKSFANRFYRMDNLNASLNYLSFARFSMPYTGNSNNMAYTRSLFSKFNGYVSQYAIPYGEDSLFINKNATKKNCIAVLDKNSIIRIRSKMSSLRWMRSKKIARLSQKHYSMGQRFALSLFPFTRCLFYATFISLLCLLPLSLFYYAILGIFGIRLISQLIVMKQAMRKLNEKGFLLLIPLLEPITILISWFVFLKANLGRKIK